MPTIYKCLNDKCGIEFEAVNDGRDHKFHSMECYRDMRSRVGKAGLAKLKSIIVSTPEPNRRGRKPKSTETTPIKAADPVKEISEQLNKDIIEEPLNEDMNVSAVISFDEMSILELKELLDMLIQERDNLIYENDLLKIKISEYLHTPDNLKDLVSEFITNAIRLEMKEDAVVIEPPPEPVTPKVEDKPRIDPEVENKIKNDQEQHEAELREKARIRALQDKQAQEKKSEEMKEWKRKEKEREKADEERKRQQEIERITKIQKDAEKAKQKQMKKNGNQDQPQTSETRICSFCEKEFIPEYPDQAFCSDQCAQDKVNKIGGVIALSSGKGFVGRPLKPGEESKQIAGAPGNGFSIR
jgi:hypothetical protein